MKEQEVAKIKERQDISATKYPITECLGTLQIIKTCKCCGKQLPTTCFYKNPIAKDGLDYFCSDCRTKALLKGGIKKRSQRKSVLKLADFSDDAIFSELKRRGYVGELSYTKVVSI